MKIMLNNNNMDNNMDYKGGFRSGPKVPDPHFSPGIFFSCERVSDGSRAFFKPEPRKVSVFEAYIFSRKWPELTECMQ